MHKSFKSIILTLLLVLLISQVAFATEPVKPPKPTEGVESSHPDRGSSWDAGGISTQSTGLISGYGCTIVNNKGSSLFLTGTTTASYLTERVGVTLYLQKWEETKWVDVRSFVYNKYYTKSITDGDYIYSFEHGNYYRTRAAHYAKDGSKTDTRSSVSSYIYID